MLLFIGNHRCTLYIVLCISFNLNCFPPEISRVPVASVSCIETCVSHKPNVNIARRPRTGVGIKKKKMTSEFRETSFRQFCFNTMRISYSTRLTFLDMVHYQFTSKT